MDSATLKRKQKKDGGLIGKQIKLTPKVNDRKYRPGTFK
jgi:hypothetical protein